MSKCQFGRGLSYPDGRCLLGLCVVEGQRGYSRRRPTTPPKMTLESKIKVRDKHAPPALLYTHELQYSISSSRNSKHDRLQVQRKPKMSTPRLPAIDYI